MTWHCTDTYIHTCMHACIHTYIHTLHTHTYVYIRIHAYIHTYTHTYIHTLHRYIHTYIPACIHTYIHYITLHTYIHTLHTHTCSETSYRITDVECIVRAKTLQLTWQENWMTSREKQWRRILSTSLLDATVPSDEVSSNSDCENRTVVWKMLENNDVPVLGLAGCHSEKWKIDAGTSSWPSWISHFTGSFVGHSPSEMLCPPAWKRNQKIMNHNKKHRSTG